MKNEEKNKVFKICIFYYDFKFSFKSFRAGVHFNFFPLKSKWNIFINTMFM